MPNPILCSNQTCPMRDCCSRALSPPSKSKQLFTHFAPKFHITEDNRVENFYCKRFLRDLSVPTKRLKKPHFWNRKPLELV